MHIPAYILLPLALLLWQNVGFIHMDRGKETSENGFIVGLASHYSLCDVLSACSLTSLRVLSTLSVVPLLVTLPLMVFRALFYYFIYS